jgi:hypothetical protein
LVILLISSCNDPIFYLVSQEQPALEPIISGSPTNFVEFKTAVYVASGKSLWRYRNNSWNRFNVQPASDGSRWVADIAATVDNLYVVVINPDSKGELWRTTAPDASNPSWNRVVSNIGNVQSIFVANNTLFICEKIGDSNSYNVFYLLNENELTPSSSLRIISTNQVLNGVAFDETNNTYYLSAGRISSSPHPPVTATNITGLPSTFLGIINTSPGHIVGITDNGRLFSVNPANSIDELDGNSNRGALAVWTNGTSSLLLAARRSGSLSSGGYMEIVIGADGRIDPTARFSEPGRREISSIGFSPADQARFINSIGKRPVNFLFQTPVHIDNDRRLFASTQLEGVWSYKNRPNDGISWNAER